jgi:hypothetical protein
MASILVWDLDKEQPMSTIQTSADSAISALVSSCHAFLTNQNIVSISQIQTW